MDISVGKLGATGVLFVGCGNERRKPVADDSTGLSRLSSRDWFRPLLPRLGVSSQAPLLAYTETGKNLSKQFIVMIGPGNGAQFAVC